MSADRKSRRGVLAAIALTDNLPMPQRVNFYDHRAVLSLDFDTVAQAEAWCSFLGYEAQPYVKDGHRYVGQFGLISWHGWDVGIHASEPAPDADDPLPGDELEALAAVDGRMP
jgi:hypothetical protein